MLILSVNTLGSFCRFFTLQNMSNVGTPLESSPHTQNIWTDCINSGIKIHFIMYRTINPETIQHPTLFQITWYFAINIWFRLTICHNVYLWDRTRYKSGLNRLGHIDSIFYFHIDNLNRLHVWNRWPIITPMVAYRLCGFLCLDWLAWELSMSMMSTTKRILSSWPSNVLLDSIIFIFISLLLHVNKI